MQNWLLIAIWAPLLWAFSNHIDKYLITCYGTGLGIKGLITFSSLFSIVVAIVTFSINPQVFAIASFNKILLLSSGFIYAFAILNYLFALSDDEASSVTPVFQLIPVFAFILGFFFLGETLASKQIVGGLIVILGAILISINLQNFKFKKKAFLLISLSSILFAVYQILFKVSAVDSFAISIFWQAIGTVLAGLLFLSLRDFRQQFFSVFKKGNSAMVWWSVVVEGFTMGGNLLVSQTVLLAPAVALVLLVESFQPMCVFILGVLITVFFPSFGKENLSKGVISQKILAIAILLFGSYLLYF